MFWNGVSAPGKVSGIFDIIGKINIRRPNKINSRGRSLKAAEAALDKKAKETIILDLRKLTAIADYFVVCSGESVTQVKAISGNIERRLREEGVRPIGIEGEDHAHWTLIDYGDVVVHIFEDETRHYYELEKFWLDAPRISLNAKDKDSMAGEDKRQEPGRGD